MAAVQNGCATNGVCPEGQKFQDQFKKFDADHDGLITLEEANAFLTEMGKPTVESEAFAKVDADSDGKITLEEFLLLSGEKCPEVNKACETQA